MGKLARRFYLSMQIDEMLPIEAYEIFIKADFATASWRFYEGKHQIVIGADIFNNLVIDASEKDKALYLRSFLYHELAHSIWTEKNIANVNEELHMRDYSFKLFNLFEDARIEEKMRHHTKKWFNWNMYEDKAEATNPIEIFFSIIQSENRNKVLKTPLFESVYNFYLEVLACETYMDIINIMYAWYKRFPQTPGYINDIKDKGYLFADESDLAINEEKFNELIEGLPNMLSIDDAVQSKRENKRQPLFVSTRYKETLLSKEPLQVPFDTKLRDKLLAKMKTLFLEPKRASSTIIASKKLHIKNIVSGSEKIFKRKDRNSNTKKNITIILDLSSSMNTTMQSMRLIIDVLDKMAQKRVINATMLLSGVDFYRPIYDKLKMPLANGVIERIVPRYRAEGLNNTMSKNLDLLISSDYVWILTDGFISEGQLNKEFYHQYKIKTHAFYIGDVSYKHKMQLSFDHVVCEANVVDLTNKIFHLIR
ncbi:MAG: hypothetical protein FP820_02495 [Sulfurimonas sp.]|nr:hypothetical protein [Sulfurimonas sp.]